MRRWTIRLLLIAVPAFFSLLAACTQKNTSTTPEVAAETLATSERIHYGDDASQFGDLQVPAGKGPFPVVVLIHGGCWLSEYGVSHLAPLAAALKREHYAVWNIEYRRLGATGGGWPQTFLDAGSALDHLSAIAAGNRLDLTRVVTVGHSAGGQLALWLAERSKLPITSEIRGDTPLAVKAAIGLAAITDLQRYRVGPPGSCHSAVEELLGGSPDMVPERYAQTSPAELLPPSVPQWLIQGRSDTIVAPEGAAEYAGSAGARVHLQSIAGGHFEPVTPEGKGWAVLLTALREALAS